MRTRRRRYITNFKQELSNNVMLTTPKDIEEAMKDMYRKYVRLENTHGRGRKGVSEGVGQGLEGGSQ